MRLDIQSHLARGRGVPPLYVPDTCIYSPTCPYLLKIKSIWTATFAKSVAKPLNVMGPQNFLPLAMTATAAGAVQYSLQGASIDASQPFSEAFVSYSIEFSSFPDFAGEDDLSAAALLFRTQDRVD